MKSYEEIAASVFEKRDAYEAQRKKRMALIGRYSTVCAGFCCIALIALGVYKGELSDVQDFEEYVGSTTEATTEAPSTQEMTSASGSSGGTYSTNQPSQGESGTDDNIQTGVMVGDVYLNEDYIYIIQDPTEPTEEQQEQSSEPTENTTAENETQADTTHGNTGSEETVGGEDPTSSDTNCGSWGDTSDYPMTESPTAETQDGPIDPTERPTPPPTASPTAPPIVTSTVASSTTVSVITSIQFVTSISDVTQSPPTSITPPDTGDTPLYLTYNKFTLSGVNYRTAGSAVNSSVVGKCIKTGVEVMADDGESYVKIDVYLISDYDQSICVAIKYQGDSNYYEADAV